MWTVLKFYYEKKKMFTLHVYVSRDTFMYPSLTTWEYFPVFTVHCFSPIGEMYNIFFEWKYNILLLFKQVPCLEGKENQKALQQNLPQSRNESDNPFPLKKVVRKKCIWPAPSHLRLNDKLNYRDISKYFNKQTQTYQGRRDDDISS